MGQTVVTFADVTVAGVVDGVSRHKTRPETWLRFKAADGQLPVIVPDDVMGHEVFKVGDHVELGCMPSMSSYAGNSSLRLVAVSFRRVPNGAKAEGGKP